MSSLNFQLHALPVVVQTVDFKPWRDEIFLTCYLRRWLHTQSVISVTVADRISLGVPNGVFKRITDACLV